VKKLEEAVRTLSVLAWSYRHEKDHDFWIYCPSCESVSVLEYLEDKNGKSYPACPECGARINYADYFYGPLLDDVMFKKS